MKIKKFLPFVLILGIILSISPLSNSPVKARWYSALNYPGVSLGYHSPSHFSLEFRSFHDGKHFLLGPRFRHHYYYYDSGNLYWAVDGYHIDYEREITEGQGTMVGGSLGLQHEIGANSTMSLDMGPYMVHMEDDYSGRDEEQVQITLNFGFQYYL